MIQKNRWGIVTLILSIAIIGAVFAVLFNYPPDKFASFYKKSIPILGIILSFTLLFAGHFSYPRVHNLKVYLTGYLHGMFWFSYFTLFRFPVLYQDGRNFLFALCFINIAITLFLPSFVKYRITKRLTFLFVAINLSILMVVKFIPYNIANWINYITPVSIISPTGIAIGVWTILLISFTFFRLRNEFHLGGLFSGGSMFVYLAWMSPILFEERFAADAQNLFVVGLVFFLQIGIIIHWFSRMEHRISYDPLLHIYNRNYCSKIIEEQSNVKTVPPFGVAMVDIDHFKKVNDTHGHEAGDKILHGVAQAILRESIPDGIVCRYGGEEIIIFFPGKTTTQLKKTVEAIRIAVEETKVQTRKKKVSVTVSIGLSCREQFSQTIEDVINTADKALYRAKHGGRNQVKIGKTPKPKSLIKKN